MLRGAWMAALVKLRRGIGHLTQRRHWAVSVRQREAGETMRFVCFSSFATATRDEGQFASRLQTKSVRITVSARGSSVIWYPRAV